MIESARHPEFDRFVRYDKSERSMLLPAVFIMAVAVLSLVLITFGLADGVLKIERPYLIPWVIATGIAFTIPVVILSRRGELKFTNPIVYPLITYFVPVFFLGGWSLAFGLSNYFYLNYVSDPRLDFPLAFVYIIVGFAALCTGYFIPQGKRIGDSLNRFLPKWDFSPAEIVISSSVFLFLGYSVNLLALELGQLGYQMGDITYGTTGSMAFFLAMMLPATTFLLWLAFFRLEKWSYLHLIIIAAQLTTVGFTLLISGGKSSFLQNAIMLIGSFVMTRDRIKLKHWTIFALIVVASVIAGTIYGSKFRDLKGTANRVSIDEYSAIAVESIGSVGSSDISSQMTDSFYLLANRLETVSALAVVVSNYDALAPYEAAYGLDTSIWTYTWTAFIPRFLWKDKPLVSDGSSFNDLYFDNPGFGLSLTVMGDLLINFGPIGVPLGMILLGIGIRVLYATLIEGKPFISWRAAIYFVVLTQISYDAFYGSIFPNVIRVAFVVALQIVTMRMIVKFFLRTHRA